MESSSAEYQSIHSRKESLGASESFYDLRFEKRANRYLIQDPNMIQIKQSNIMAPKSNRSE